jgi:broad specificity phosphatase PhoE
VTARQVIIWRHGRTEYNLQWRMQGQVDTELDEVGKQQARMVAPILAQDYRPDLIVTSDLSRAARTAEALADLTGLTPVPDPRLRERGFGKWEGLTQEEVEERWPGCWLKWRRGPDYGDVGIEPIEELAERAVASITEHTEAVPDGGTLVIVAHGALATVATKVLIGLSTDWRGMVGLANAHFTVLLPSRRGVGAWRVLAHNVGVDPATEG